MQILRVSASFFFFLFVALLSSCRKDAIESATSPDQSNNTNTAGIVDSRSNNEAPGCDHIPAETNFASFIFKQPDGSFASSECYTEQDLADIFIGQNGLNEESVKTLFSNLFYRAETASPAAAFELGRMMAQSQGYIPESFNIDVMGRADYPAQTTGNYNPSEPAPGFIDFYTIRQAQAAPGDPLVLLNGFSGMRFQNKCTGQTITYTFSPSLDEFKRTFTSAGFSTKITELIVKNITSGNYSIRQVWDLFQIKLAPKLFVVQELMARPDASCWRLKQVGIGLYNAGHTKASFYYAQGDGALK